MKTRTLAILLAVWCAGLVVGGYEMFDYMTTAGEVAATPVAWPTDSAIARSTTGSTVVMFVTPACPCSRASLAELALVHAEHAIVVTTGPVPRDADPAFTWIEDPGGETGRFGARTSGFVVAYDARGDLRFSGGITGARGHVGANVGRDLLVAALGDRTRAATHAVFGCAL